MKAKNNFIVYILIFQSFFLSSSCDKNESIELNNIYLTVTDVLKYCSRECGEYQDLKGEPIKIKGYLRVNSQGQFIKEVTNSKDVFVLNDIRNSKLMRIEIVDDSLEIANKLFQNSEKMVLVSGILNYGFFISSNSHCDNTLFIELDNANNLSFK